LFIKASLGILKTGSISKIEKEYRSTRQTNYKLLAQKRMRLENHYSRQLEIVIKINNFNQLIVHQKQKRAGSIQPSKRKP
jgi:zona occludens toxin (predicted ATPase)